MIYIKYSEIAADNLFPIKLYGHIFHYIVSTFDEIPKEISLYDAINKVRTYGYVLSNNLFNAIVKEYKDNKDPKETVYKYDYLYNDIESILSYKSGYQPFLIMEVTKRNSITIHNLNVIILEADDDNIIISFKNKDNGRTSYKIKLIDDIEERRKQEEKDKTNNKRNRKKNSKKKEELSNRYDD